MASAQLEQSQMDSSAIMALAAMDILMLSGNEAWTLLKSVVI
jgi:hypothetical protein